MFRSLILKLSASALPAVLFLHGCKQEKDGQNSKDSEKSLQKKAELENAAKKAQLVRELCVPARLYGRDRSLISISILLYAMLIMV